MVRIKLWPVSWSLGFFFLSLAQVAILLGMGNLLSKTDWFFIGLLGLLEMFVLFWIRRGKLYLFPLFYFFYFLLTLALWIQNVLERQMWVVGVSILTSGLLFWILSKISEQAGRAYCRSFRRWYEGEWSAISGLVGQIETANGSVDVQFHRIDLYGAWVFTSNLDQGLQLNKKYLLHWQDKQVPVPPIQVKCVSLQTLKSQSKELTAFGLQFLPEDRYHQRKITQWIETWEGEHRCGTWVSPKPWFEHWF